MTWKELLARTDLVGGYIQLRIKEDGVYRAQIIAVDASQETVHFRTKDTCKESMNGLRSSWNTCKNMICRFPTTTDLLGGQTGRVQFDTKDGWAIIYPRGDEPSTK